MKRHSPTATVQSADDIIGYTPFPSPNVNAYLQEDQSQRIRGAKFSFLYTFYKIEIVRYLRNPVQYDNYAVEYVVTRMVAEIDDEGLTFKEVMEFIAEDKSLISQYDIRYGMTDDLWQHFGNSDGLHSLTLKAYL